MLTYSSPKSIRAKLQTWYARVDSQSMLTCEISSGAPVYCVVRSLRARTSKFGRIFNVQYPVA